MAGKLPAGGSPPPPRCPDAPQGRNYDRPIGCSTSAPVRRAGPRLLGGLLAVLAVVVGLPLAGGAQTTTTTAPPPPPPAAFIVVDMATGAVLLGQNEHVRRPPASISKLMTSLVVRRELDDDSPIKVSPAAAAMPARKLNLQAGQVWNEHDLLQAMLLCSCNDIARALAESAGGSVGGFGSLARKEAKRLGVVDSPVLQDPAGLDDEYSVAGGNRVSAYDMAVIARAFEADPTLAFAVTVPKFQFRGPDAVVHEVLNHNRLFGTYEGAIGVKTGYTKRAGATLVAAATRNGRTILVVILGSVDIWYHAPQLLDYGFRTPVAASMARLPAVPGAAAEATPTTVASGTFPSTVPASTPVSRVDGATTIPEPAPARHRSGLATAGLVALGVLLVLVLLVALRRRQVVRRRAARARSRDAALAALVGD